MHKENNLSFKSLIRNLLLWRWQSDGDAFAILRINRFEFIIFCWRRKKQARIFLLRQNITGLRLVQTYHHHIKFISLACFVLRTQKMQQIEKVLSTLAFSSVHTTAYYAAQNDRLFTGKKYFH